MAYNPEHLIPPDNPNAFFCKYCTDQILDDEDWELRRNGDEVHIDCLGGYSDGLLLEIEDLYLEIERITRVDFS